MQIPWYNPIYWYLHWTLKPTALILSAILYFFWFDTIQYSIVLCQDSTKLFALGKLSITELWQLHISIGNGGVLLLFICRPPIQASSKWFATAAAWKNHFTLLLIAPKFPQICNRHKTDNCFVILCHKFPIVFEKLYAKHSPELLQLCDDPLIKCGTRRHWIKPILKNWKLRTDIILWLKSLFIVIYYVNAGVTQVPHYYYWFIFIVWDIFPK